MLTFNYGFWDKVLLTKFISGCHMVWDLICGTSWFFKGKNWKRRRKVCYSAQLLLPSFYNSALLYTRSLLGKTLHKNWCPKMFKNNRSHVNRIRGSHFLDQKSIGIKSVATLGWEHKSTFGSIHFLSEIVNLPRNIFTSYISGNDLKSDKKIEQYCTMTNKGCFIHHNETSET